MEIDVFNLSRRDSSDSLSELGVQLADEQNVLLDNLVVGLARLLQPDVVLFRGRRVLVLGELVRIPVFVLLKEGVERGCLLVARLSIFHYVVKGLLGQKKQVSQQLFVCYFRKGSHVHLDHLD